MREMQLHFVRGSAKNDSARQVRMYKDIKGLQPVCLQMVGNRSNKYMASARSFFEIPERLPSKAVTQMLPTRLQSRRPPVVPAEAGGYPRKVHGCPLNICLQEIEHVGHSSKQLGFLGFLFKNTSSHIVPGNMQEWELDSTLKDHLVDSGGQTD